MKRKQLTIALLCAISTRANAQTEEHRMPHFNDALSPIINTTVNKTELDLSKVNLKDYVPSETDFDLLPSINIEDVKLQNLKQGDSLTGVITLAPNSKYSNLITKTGAYIAKQQYVGTLKTPTETYTNVSKIKIMENYTIINKEDGFCLYYENVYNHFCVEGVLQPVLTYTEKLRSSCKTRVSEYYKSITQPASEQLIADLNLSTLVTKIKLTCSPNPATGNTTISYNLPTSSNVKLVVENTSNNSNIVVENTNKEKGSHTLNLPLHTLIPSPYIVKLYYQGAIFTTQLIIY
jgi:hypothetical protein